MKIENPNVTMEDELQTRLPNGEMGAFCDWMTQYQFEDEQGELYSLALTLMNMEGRRMQVFIAQLAKGRGSVRQLQNSIYKKAAFPPMCFNKQSVHTDSEIHITRQENSASLQLKNELEIIFHEDKSWNIKYDSGDGKLQIALAHRPVGFPLWYGREKPSYFSQHCIQYGYVWSGKAEAVITFEGKEIKVTGSGIRERSVSVDNSTAEVGAWEDWGQFNFDEINTELWHMRISGNKDMHIYDKENHLDYADGELEIEHEDWAYISEYDGFLPMTYKITERFEGGVLKIKAHMVSSIYWGVTHNYPESPCATALFEGIEGKIIYDNGTERILTNGRGSMSIRQWHPYPNLFPKELFCGDSESDNKYELF